MIKAAEDCQHGGSTIPFAVLIVDDKDDIRTDLREQIAKQFGGRCAVYEAANATEAFRQLDGLTAQNPQVVAVDLALASRLSIKPALDLIAKLRKRLPEDTRILGYTLKPLGDIRKPVMDAGASSYVRTEEVAGVIAQISLEKELHELQTTSPLVGQILNDMSMGITIEDTDYHVLWANNRVRKKTRIEHFRGQRCWRCFHNFLHRRIPCAGCIAAQVKEKEEALIQEGKIHPDVRMNGIELLPVDGKIVPVEVDTAALLDSAGTRVLAIIEAVQFVEEEWKRAHPAHDRLAQVMAVARAMARQSEDALPCASLCIYYQPADTEDLHLFLANTERGTEPPPKLLRHKALTVPYREVLAGEGGRVLPAFTPGETPSHFLWSCTSDGATGTRLLIDVTFFDEKPVGLFTHDLEPYWRYLRENFEEARENRDQQLSMEAQTAVREFLAQTAEGTRGERITEDLILQEAVACVQKALKPVSMHIRTLDRKSNCLTKRAGFGPYYEIASERRLLDLDGIGSVPAASTRQEVWAPRASVESIKDSVEGDLTEAASLELEKIASYAILPLVFSQRTLGTLSAQFDDDTLFSERRKDSLRHVAGALSNALGQLAWTEERRLMADDFRSLDQMMFGSAPEIAPARQENEVLRLAAQMVFDLTCSHAILFYRYDRQNARLCYVEDSFQGTLREGIEVPPVLPADLGLVGEAVRTRQTQVARNYQEEHFSISRQELLDAVPDGAQRKAVEWIGGTDVAPVLVGDQVEGVLVALSPIPNWLTDEDIGIVNEFAFKIGRCIEAMRLGQHLNRELKAMQSLVLVEAAMAGTSDKDALNRLFLLGITAGECLRFSRAILFLRQRGDPDRLNAVMAIGAIDRPTARALFDGADAISLEEKIDRCLARNEAPTAGALQGHIHGLVLELNQEPVLRAVFHQSQLALCRRDDDHVVVCPQLRDLLVPPGEDPAEYVLAPVMAEKELVGAVLADRTFLDPCEIAEEDRNLLQVLSRDFGLMLQAIDRRRKEQEASISEQLAFGVSYALSTRTAAFESHLSILKRELHGAHGEAVAGMERALEFFARAGTLASRHLRADLLAIEEQERLDLNDVLAETIGFVADTRIDFSSSPGSVVVSGNRGEIGNLFLEILANARDFAPADKGRIEVRVARERGMCRVDILDNGPGVLPAIRPKLFEKFVRHPAGRLGLGLSYAKTVSGAYGGSIDEIGQPGRGAHFVVRLPAATEE